MDDIIKITPDKERARSLMSMAGIRMESIELMRRKDAEKFAPKIVEEYYETLLEIITAIMSKDGFKIRSDALGSHKIAISYLSKYPEISQHEMHLIDNLRQMRNGIKYYGRNIDSGYMSRREMDIKRTISNLKSLANKDL
ncbi:MAG: hypothetical protein HYX24_04600 [Candidatus Aenigmarchaeota archaeon]|nr:hypothetical protein [Candidatus Aenigmarchaeota archaeon]